jgi:hypothetical protein
MNRQQVHQESGAVAMPTDSYAAHRLDETFVQWYGEGIHAAKMADHPWRGGRFFQMIRMLQLTDGLEAATAECGCYRGLSSFLICQYRRLREPDFRGATHFVIDSFEGLSRPVAVDGDFSARRHAENAFKQTSVEHVRQTLRDFPAVPIFKGWIPDVFSELPDQAYRFVHIDVDIYEPTLAAFRYFYPRLVAGGIIVCDDYGPWPDGNWPGCKVACEEFSREIGVPYAGLETGNAVMIKRAPIPTRSLSIGTRRQPTDKS